MGALTVLTGGPADPSGRRGRDLVHLHAAGQLVRLAPGRYVSRSAWEAASPRERHLARITVMHDRVDPRLIVSHCSAVAVHDLPWRGEWPERVDIIDPLRRRGQSTVNLRKRPGAGRERGLDMTHRRPVTDLVATGVDIAVTETMRRSVPIIDAILARDVARADLMAELERRDLDRREHRARESIEFADPGSGSLGESVCRVVLAEIGAPSPELQRVFHDADGFVARVDFWFPDQRVVLEFDGAVKYLDRTMRDGRDPAQVVLDEKRREDRLRRHPEVAGVVRCDTADVAQPALLRRILLGAGVPLELRRFLHVR